MAVIYLVRASNGMVKIGMTSNPRARLAGLQTGSPLQLSIVHRRSVPTPRARTAEKRIHHTLRAHRAHGEWFSCPIPKAIAEIDRTALREEQAHADSFLFEHGEEETGRLEQEITLTCKHCSHSKRVTLTLSQISRCKFKCSDCGKRT